MTPPRSLLLPALALLGLACAPQSQPECPEPSVTPRVPDVDPTPEPSTAEPAEPATSTATAVRPAKDFPIPSNCEAPLAITQEVSRLLTAAAAHGTRSAACVDGRGHRLAINDLLVCPAAPDTGDTIVDVFYQVATYPEGDTRGCREPGDCEWLTPTSVDVETKLRFRPGKTKGQGTLVLEGPVPGFPDDSTPLSEAHDGNCYGRSPAFTPAEIPITR
ncbi:MAG: hypothetical protein AAF799_40550 [Myxococcota bacterium]